MPAPAAKGEAEGGKARFLEKAERALASGATVADEVRRQKEQVAAQVAGLEVVGLEVEPEAVEPHAADPAPAA